MKPYIETAIETQTLQMEKWNGNMFRSKIINLLDDEDENFLKDVLSYIQAKQSQKLQQKQSYIHIYLRVKVWGHFRKEIENLQTNGIEGFLRWEFFALAKDDQGILNVYITAVVIIPFSIILQQR